jgi:hypothetical protein
VGFSQEPKGDFPLSALVIDFIIKVFQSVSFIVRNQEQISFKNCIKVFGCDVI